MGILIIITIALLFGLCFSLYNWWFQHEKYKRYLDHEKRTLSPWNSPFAWGCYTLIFFLTILGVILFFISELAGDLLQLKIQ